MCAPALPYFLNGNILLARDQEIHITCEICQAVVRNDKVVEHMEKCAEGSSVAYYLKMALLQHEKTLDFSRILFLRAGDMMIDRPLLLPKGICYYCDTPEQHRNKHCHQATRAEYFKKMREKVTPDHLWSITMHFDFLKKSQMEILTVKHRRELEPYYKKFETERHAIDVLEEQVAPDAVSWPVNSICQEVQVVHQRHAKEIEERKRQLEDFYKEQYTETTWNRRKLYDSLQANLVTIDRDSPERKWAFI